MKLAEYSPDDFGSLQTAVESANPGSALLHRPFVDYYYTTREWCKLYLLMGQDGAVIGTLGVDLMRFAIGERQLTLGFGTNFNALKPGVGGFLFMQWVKSCDAGIVFGGAPMTHDIIRAQGWTFYTGVRTFHVNRPYPTLDGEPLWKTAAKWLRRHSVRPQLVSRISSRIPRSVAKTIAVREETEFVEDLFPRRSPFGLRLSPTLEYLAWRYNTQLSFVRYRLFRVASLDKTVGYVIINDKPDRLLVAQCDGEDPVSLAYGVALALAEVADADDGPRQVMLTSSNPDMQRVYWSLGLKANRRQHPLAIGAWRQSVDVPPDTSSWLVNFDWGDNGLRAPFLDQEPVSPI